MLVVPQEVPGQLVVAARGYLVGQSLARARSPAPRSAPAATVPAGGLRVEGCGSGVAAAWVATRGYLVGGALARAGSATPRSAAAATATTRREDRDAGRCRRCGVEPRAARAWVVGSEHESIRSRALGASSRDALRSSRCGRAAPHPARRCARVPPRSCSRRRPEPASRGRPAPPGEVDPRGRPFRMAPLPGRGPTPAGTASAEESRTGRLAQLVRAHPLQGWGRRFDPCIAHRGSPLAPPGRRTRTDTVGA